MCTLPDNVRVEHALEAGGVVSPWYDSMIAKLVAYATDRAGARAVLCAALRGTRVLGVRTNQAFLDAALEHEEFAGGGATTAFVERHGESLLGGLPRLPAAVAALLAYAVRAAQNGHDPAGVLLPPAWPVPLRLVVDDLALAATVLALGGWRYRVNVEHGTHELTLAEWTGSGAVISGETDRMELAVRAAGTRIFVGWGSSQAVIDDVSLQAAASAGAAGHKLLRAPMAGRIVSLSAAVGQTVGKGAVLLALEAMKMEHPALAPMAATVTAVHVALGAQVTAGAPLVDLEPLAG